MPVGVLMCSRNLRELHGDETGYVPIHNQTHNFHPQPHKLSAFYPRPHPNDPIKSISIPAAFLIQYLSVPFIRKPVLFLMILVFRCSNAYN